MIADISGWEYCTDCVRYHAPNNHLPLWEVWDMDGSDRPDFSPEIEKVFAIDAQDAAEKWAKAQDSDSAEYAIVAGRYEPTVAVRKVGWPEDRRVLYVIMGEAVPEYRAHFKVDQGIK